MPASADRQAYWRRTRLLTAALLVVWFVFGLGVHFYARELNFTFFGWPFSFWMAAQGSLLVFVLIIVVHAWCMEKLDVAHELEED